MKEFFSRVNALFFLIVPLALPHGVRAQTGTYPERAINLIVPFAPGAGTDAMGRLLGAKLAEAFKEKVVVENKTGASGAIGARYVAQSAPDGYTLLLIASPFTTTAASVSDAGYDPVKQFSPISLVATGPLVWAANIKVPFNTLLELLEYSRKNPGRVNYGSAGAGSVNHLVLELLQAKAGIYIAHIPYRGIAPATTDMISGEIQLVTGTIPALSGFIRDGRVKALAVTSAKRSPALPAIPSMAESGLRGFDVLNYFGIVGPADMPAGIVARLNAELHRVVAQPDVVKRFATDALESAVGTPAQLGQFIAADFESWRAMVKLQNLRIQ